ncbi:MAG: AMP-binding protein [bacterium]
MSYGSKSVRSLYYSLPLTAKNLFASAYGWNERRGRYGRTYHESLSMLRESQYWSNERLLEYQHQRVSQFLPDVITSSSYYRGNHIYSALVKANAPLNAFPLLAKTALRHEPKNFYHDELESMRIRWMSTSGTTGSPLISPVTEQHFQRECAFRALAYEWAGVSLDSHDRVAFCAGHPVAHADRQRPPFWVYDWANNWLYFSSYHLSRRNLQDYIAELEKFQPVMLGGYPSSLYLLALAYEKFGGSLKLKAIMSSSETLFAWQRERIERAFGAKVFNWYGTGETCANVAECAEGELHLKLEHSAVEVLNDQNEPCPPGETGRFVSTGFDNYAFPLIRYDIGDEVTVAGNQAAKCGRGGLLLEKVLGFVDDYVFTSEGRFIGRLDHLIKDRVNVVEAQFYQERVDELICRIVKTDNYSEADERAILDEARRRLGTILKISFEYLERIPRTKNGKLRMVVSAVDQSKALKSFQL